jgi:hypothetical protein
LAKHELVECYQKVLDNLYRCLQESFLINRQRSNHFAIPLKTSNLKEKFKNQLVVIKKTSVVLLRKTGNTNRKTYLEPVLVSFISSDDVALYRFSWDQYDENWGRRAGLTKTIL